VRRVRDERDRAGEDTCGELDHDERAIERDRERKSSTGARRMRVRMPVAMAVLVGMVVPAAHFTDS
jgi:hypothetical protein